MFSRRAGIVSAAAFFSLLLSFLPPVKGLEVAWYYAWSKPAKLQAAPVSLVLEAGNTTAQQVGAWPWPHQYLATVIDTLVSGGASAIVIDDSLNGQTNAVADELLERSLIKNGPLVYFTSSFLEEDKNSPDVPPRFAVQAKGIVQMETQAGQNGISEFWLPGIRVKQGAMRVHASLRLLMDNFSEKYAALEKGIRPEQMLIPWQKKDVERISRYEYSGWLQTLERIKQSGADVSSEVLPVGKVVWLGPAVSRFEASPWYEPVSRVRLSAMLFEQMRSGRAEAPLTAGESTGIFLLVAGLLIFLSRRRGIVFWISWCGILAAVLLISWIGLSFFQIYWPPVAVLILAALTALGLLIEDLMRTESDKQLFFHLATRDGLTNLYGIRHFRLMMNQLVVEAVAKSENLALILIDLDRFKAINDTFGHPAGDEALRRAADTILSVVRQKRPIEDLDFVARYGGEEFMILVRNCGLDMAAEVAERIREEVEKLIISWGSARIHLTASFGVAMLERGETIPDPMVHRADKALYLAKHSGRNQVRTQKDV